MPVLYYDTNKVGYSTSIIHRITLYLLQIKESFRKSNHIISKYYIIRRILSDFLFNNSHFFKRFIFDKVEYFFQIIHKTYNIYYIGFNLSNRYKGINLLKSIFYEYNNVYVI
jgi:hypothetical protein